MFKIIILCKFINIGYDINENTNLVIPIIFGSQIKKELFKKKTQYHIIFKT